MGMYLSVCTLHCSQKAGREDRSGNSSPESQQSLLCNQQPSLLTMLTTTLIHSSFFSFSHLPADLLVGADGYQGVAAAQTPSGWIPGTGGSWRLHWKETRRRSEAGSLGRLALVPLDKATWQRLRAHSLTRPALTMCHVLVLCCLLPSELVGWVGPFLSCLSDAANEGSLELGSWLWAYWLLLVFCFGGDNFLSVPRRMFQSGPNLKTWCKTSINPTMPTHRSKGTQKSQSPVKFGAYDRSSSGLHRSHCSS